ncbi:MAG TPA: sugar transferase [Planctomycetota bacterium]|nr:sugar transferase [Planctomycetota bacterium]
MLKGYSRAVATSIFVADLTLTIFSFLGTYLLMSVPNQMFGTLLPLDQYLWLLLFIVPAWTMLLQWSGTYRSHRIQSPIREITQVARAAALGGIALFAFVGLTKSSHISRPFLSAFMLIDVSVLVLLRMAIRTAAHAARARGYNTRSVLIVGTGEGAAAHAERIAANRHWGHRLIGFVSQDEEEDEIRIPRGSVVGKTNSIRRVLCEYVVDEVVVAVPPQRLSNIESLLLHCEQVGVKTRLALDLFPHQIARVEMEDMDGCPMLTFSTTPPEDFAMGIKRAIDVVFSSLFLLSFSWLYLTIALLIKATSKGPVFFRQERVGMNGRRFTFFKFRSMVVDAERRKAELQHLNEMDGPVFKIKNDPRVTRVGRFIRKFSLDELPQMWNVLRGDMSLVGPRPPVPSEVHQYESWARRRLSVRPGITCLWQVSGRNSINFNQWMELDLAYIDNWTLGLDMKILLKTIPAVLAGRGAS